MIDAFATLAMSSGKFEGRSSVKTYLFAIGKNLALKSIRKRHGVQQVPFETIADVFSDEDESPDNIVEREERKQVVIDAMRELKGDYRAVLVFLYYENLSYIETAQAMDKSVDQIKVLAHRAKAALKKQLEVNNMNEII